MRNIKLFLLDMDGTLYLGDKLFEGTIDFLDEIKKRGGKYVFMTNNSSKSVDKYIDKLAQMGIDAKRDDFLTSTDATIPILQRNNYKKIYALGTQSFKEQLCGAGLPVVDALYDDIDCLCMGYDTELTYKKLEDACVLLNRGIDYIATNPDWVCPTEYGYAPDCGSVAEMLYKATGRRPKFIGKPEPEMAYLSMEKYGFSKQETAVVGDRIYTDIACGKNAGIGTIFVLSGEGTREDIQKYQTEPEYIFENIAEVCRAFKESVLTDGDR